MPAHDWTRVPPNIFHDFHLSWLVEAKTALNQRVLPATHYALIEQHRDQGASVCNRITLNEELDEELSLYIQKRRSLVIRDTSDDRGIAILEVLVPDLLAVREIRATFLKKLWAMFEGGMQIYLLNLLPPSHPLESLVADVLWSWQVGAELVALGDNMAAIVINPNPEGARVWLFAEGDPIPDATVVLNGNNLTIPLDAAYNRAYSSLPKHVRPVGRNAVLTPDS